MAPRIVPEPPPETETRWPLIAFIGWGICAALLALGFHGLDVLALGPSAFMRPAVWRAGLSTSYALTVGAMVLALLAALGALHRRARRGARILSLAALAIAQDENPPRPPRGAGEITASAGGFDGTNAKTRNRRGGERTAGNPGLPAFRRLDREIFRRRPDHPASAMVAQGLLGDLDGAAQVEDSFDVTIGQVKDAFVLHRIVI